MRPSNAQLKYAALELRSLAAALGIAQEGGAIFYPGSFVEQGHESALREAARDLAAVAAWLDEEVRLGLLVSRIGGEP